MKQLCAWFIVMQNEGRAHFNCPTLGGVELENQGGSGTAGSHWEKRILGVGLPLCINTVLNNKWKSTLLKAL